MRKLYIFTIAALAAAVLAGCAKTRTEDETTELRDFFLAWMAYTYPNVSANSNGIYILEEEEGNGVLYNDQDFAHMEVTIADLEGNISSTNNLKVAQQLGTYNKTNYYGPVLQYAGEYISAGLYYTLKGMKKGGTRKVIIPFWLNTYSRYDSQEEYIKHATSSSSGSMYTIHLSDFTNDAEQWEIDSLQRHLVNLYKESADSVSYGLYYHPLKEPVDTTSFPVDTVVYINYTGRLLNGQVFDTTIKDTAIVHNIYSTSKTYAPQPVRWASNAEGMTLNSSSVITGFAQTMRQMRKYEKGIGYFISKLGYSSSGSGSTIPAYSPLSFEIELVDKPE